jgi:hypothetical protein
MGFHKVKKTSSGSLHLQKKKIIIIINEWKEGKDVSQNKENNNKSLNTINAMKCKQERVK